MKDKSTILRIAVTLVITYLLCWFLLAVMALSNTRTDGHFAILNGLMFFITHILSFPTNLINPEYPFLLEYTESGLKPIVLIGINLILQVMLTHWIFKVVKRITGRVT